MSEERVIPNHIHCVVRATLDRHFFSLTFGDWRDVRDYGRDDVREWLESLVDALHMNVMAGPLMFYNIRPGLEGWSAAVLIETSSITLHAFDQPDGKCLFELDVYTCGDFSLHTVKEKLLEVGLAEWAWKTFDRSDFSLRVLDRGHEVL